MNLANKITLSRIFLSIMILVLLLFPWYQVGIDMPVYSLNGNMTIELKYIIAGVLFVVASLTDFIDGHIARKHNQISRQERRELRNLTAKQKGLPFIPKPR